MPSQCFTYLTLHRRPRPFHLPAPQLIALINDLTAPTLLIYERRVRNNLQRMTDRARRHGLVLAPHAKTYRDPRLNPWLKEFGIREISVTGVEMARTQVQDWEGLTIAMPTQARQWAAVNELAQQTKLTVFLTDVDSARSFGEYVDASVRYFVEIDCGYGRTGVPWQDATGVRDIVRAAGRKRFRGLYVHSGHTYAATSVADISAIHQRMLQRLTTLRAELADFPQLELMVGDTPACSTQEDFTGLHRIGPGNFIYYDLVQQSLGSCALSDIAICAALPIIGHRPTEKTSVVHGGWVQLGRDSLMVDDRPYYGRVVALSNTGHWDAEEELGIVTGLSQEHGSINWHRETTARQFAVGDMIGVLPVHACALVNGLGSPASCII